MKTALSSLVALILALGAAPSAQTPRYPAPENMQTVHVALLLTAPNVTPGPMTPELQKIQDAHIAHLTNVNGGDRLGVVILAVDTIEKAKALLDQDPGVKSGRFTVELFQWFAAGGILKGK